MKTSNIVKREFALTNHEIIINGVRFTIDKIIKAKHFANAKYKNEKIKTTYLCFNLDYGTVSIE